MRVIVIGNRHSPRHGAWVQTDRDHYELTTFCREVYPRYPTSGSSVRLYFIGCPIKTAPSKEEWDRLLLLGLAEHAEVYEVEGGEARLCG